MNVTLPDQEGCCRLRRVVWARWRADLSAPCAICVARAFGLNHMPARRCAALGCGTLLLRNGDGAAPGSGMEWSAEQSGAEQRE